METRQHRFSYFIVRFTSSSQRWQFLELFLESIFHPSKFVVVLCSNLDSINFVWWIKSLIRSHALYEKAVHLIRPAYAFRWNWRTAANEIGHHVIILDIRNCLCVVRSNFFVRLTWNVLSSVMKLKSFALFVLVTKETLNWSTCFTFCTSKSDAALNAGQRFYNK